MRNIHFIEGVNIIAKHMPSTAELQWDLCAEHDQIWFGDVDWVNSSEDLERLEELGWFNDEGAWSCYP